MVWGGLGFRVLGGFWGFRVQGLGAYEVPMFRVQGFRLRVFWSVRSASLGYFRCVA